MSKPVCIIPARMGSKRLPRKNVTMCDGKPLIYYTIKEAKDSGVFSDIIVSTDDPIAYSIAQEMGVWVKGRDSQLASDTATVVDVVFNVINGFYITTPEGGKEDVKTFAVLLPTCPLRTADDIDRCYHNALWGYDGDFAMSVTKYDYHPFQALRVNRGSRPLLEPCTHKISGQSQEWESLYHHNGAIIFGHTEALKKHKSFYGGKVIPYFMPRERSVDIDTKDDLEYAEYLLKKRRGAV